MRAAVLTEFGSPLRVENVEPLPLGPRDVTVRPGAVEMCVTDCYATRPNPLTELPTILGHSAAGIVEEVGAAVPHIRPGARVVVAGTPACGACRYCARGQPYQCREIFEPETRYVAALRDGAHVSAGGGVGSYAELARVPDFGVVEIGADVPDEHLCLLSCGVTSALGTVFRIAQVELADSVAVFGCGRIGGWLVQAARLAGAGRIVVVEPLAQRRGLATKLGATDVLDPADDDAVAQVRALTDGDGVDHAFEATGDATAMEQAFAATRRGGAVVPMGMTDWDATVAVPANELAMTGRRILSCQYGNVDARRDLPRFARVLGAGLLDPAPMIDRTFQLDEVNEALDAIDSKGVTTAILEPTA